MIRRLGVLLLGTVAGFVVFYLPMRFLVKETPPLVILLAATVSFVPGMIVLIAARRLRDQPPEVKIVGVLLTTLFRMVLAVGGGILLYAESPIIREFAAGFFGWALVFYLVTLFVETGLLYTESSGTAKP